MKLLTKEIVDKFAKVGSQEQVEDPKVIVKFFGGGSGTWLATEYDPETKVFFGYVSLFNDHNNEWGSFALEELEGLRFPPLGLPVERDMYLSETTVGEYKKNYGMH